MRRILPTDPPGRLDLPADHVDNGPSLRWERRKPAPKSTEELAEIRAKAWNTRRERYGKRGHK